LGELETLSDRYAGDVAFFVVYIREAHPEDGWVLSDNRAAGIAFTDPTDFGEREAVAETCAIGLRIPWPVVVDNTDDAVARAYGGWPDRLYLIGRDGRVAFRGGEGPFGFKPHELAEAIASELGHA
jgi:iodothyronine deiodinase-like protein